MSSIIPSGIQRWRSAKCSKGVSDDIMATKTSRFGDSSDANGFSIATTVLRDDLQAPTRRRASLIPQRTTSIRSPDVSRPQHGRVTAKPERDSSTNIKAAGLQRSQSTKHFVDLKQRQMPTHQRLNSLSCSSSETPGNRLAARSSGATSLFGKRQDALPTSSQQKALHSIETISHPKMNSADAPKAAEADYKHEVANEVTMKTKHVDSRRRTLISNGDYLNPARTSRRLETENATEDVLPVATGLLVPVAKLNRPAFSALQQDFGTKQLPKELPCLPHTPNGVTIEQLSPEALVSNLELLQLHMLHRSSFATKLQWESSAEKYYKGRFDELASNHESMTTRERNLQEQVNASAVIAWGNGTDHVSVGLKIRKLSRILNEVVEVSDPSGQYSCLIKSFEHWYSYASRTRQLRATRDGYHPHIDRALEGMGDGWKAEADTLTSKFLTYQEELIFLGDASPKSDLIRCIDAVLGSLTNMLEELDLIQAIESQLLCEEESWLNDSLGRIAAELSSGMSVRANSQRRR